MRITYKPVKRVAPAHPQVAALIDSLLDTPTEKLSDVLEGIHSWRYPRSDLHSWITVLNRMDEIYEDIIQEYDLSKLQSKPFSAETKRILLSMLRFQRLLLDNSTNRKLYNSYDKLNIMISNSDLDVLTSVLQLILRPAQQYSAQPSVAQALRITPAKFQALARHWPVYSEHGLSLADLASSGADEIAAVESLPPECSDLTFTFYRRETSSMDALQTTGPTTINLSALSQSQQEPFDILVSTVQTYQVPPDDHVELLSRIRAHWIMGKGRYEQRSKLTVIRLLSLAIFCHTHQEQEAQTSILMYEPDIVGHISSLLQLGKDIPPPVRTAALAALDALSRYRGRTQDVLSGVNAGVNHGLLMTLLRRTIHDMADPSNDIPQSFIEALLSFISFLATHTAGGNMLIGAGIIPLLIEVTKNQLPRRLAIVSKTMTLIDNILYGYQNAFQVFVGAGGVNVMVDRVKHEVGLGLELEKDNRAGGSTGSSPNLSIQRSALLKHLLRSVHRMMHSSGTTEGLRGLIDSSLVKSIKLIMEHRVLFGSSVLPLAINIMTTFIHNEPTSLHVIQEAKLPEVFYSAIESGLEPIMEVIQSVPNAMGALCLNQAGANQLLDRPQVLERFFDIFTTDKHVKLLQDKDNAVIVGNAIDELVRHHPALCDRVFAAIAQVLEKIEISGRHLEEDSTSSHLYRLVTKLENQSAGEKIKELNHDVTWNSNVDRTPMEVEVEGNEFAAEARKVENPVTASLDVFSRFLEGLFQHAQHCKDFVEKANGLERLSRILALPCLPFDFGLSVGSDALVQVMRSLVEASPNATLTEFAKQVQLSVQETQRHWEHNDNSSQLFPLLEPQDKMQLEQANEHFRSLVTLHIRITLLSDVCQVAGYPQSRSVNLVLQTLTASEVHGLIPALGALHRHSIWEHLNLSRQLNAKGLGHLGQPSTSQSAALQEGSPSDSPVDVFGAPPQVSASQTNAVDPPENAIDAIEDDSTKQNAKALMHVASELPKTLKNFFTALVKMFLFSRRHPDSSQRDQASQSADMIADLLLEHLNFPPEDTDLVNVFAYEAVVIRLISAMLFDDRTSDWALHTGLLLGITRKGVLEVIIQVLNKCLSSISRLSDIEMSSRSDVEATELLRAITCTKVAMKLLVSLTSAKSILESGQTAFNVTIEKEPKDVHYFEPHDLICRIRMAILPSLQLLWRTSWLSTVAGILCRDVVQAMMEVLDAEGEQPPSSVEARSQPLSGAETRSHRQPEPDENRIRQLCDMGFPRSAATRALQRTNNNINAATEYLLAHPLPFPPDPAQSSANNGDAPEEETPADGEATISGTKKEEKGAPDALQTPDTGEASCEQTATRAPLTEVLEELNKLREPLRQDFGKVALALLDHNPDLIFIVRPAFIDSGWKTKNLQAILDDIRAFAPSAHDMYELPLVQRFRLLALVLDSTPALSLKEHELKGLIAHCLALLLANPVNSGPASVTTPRWLAPLLLVVHSLFIKGEEPRGIDPTAQDVDKDEPLFIGPTYAESRPLIFNICLRVLSRPATSSDELQAALQLLVHLTRDPVLAKEFYTRGGIKHALEMLRQSGGRSSTIRLQVVLLLRHIAEDEETLESLMRYEITRRFVPRSRALDVKGLVRHTSPIVLRDPGLFLRVTQSICELLPTDPNLDHLVLKKRSAVPSETHGDQAAMQVDDRTSMSSTGVEGLIHQLLAALVDSGRPAVDYTIHPNHSRPSGDGSGGERVESSQDASKQQDERPEYQEGYNHYLTTCFVMQCLTELLLSYSHCKAAFLSFNKKRGDSSTKENRGTRPPVLNILLSDIVCYSSLTRPESADSRKRALLSQGGMSVILALCVDPMPQKLDSKDISGELTAIRKAVLDTIIKVIKEASSTSSPESRYGKIASLADLIYRLLVLKSTFGSSKERDDTPLQIAKLMLEKNFVSILTSTLSEIDPNYPGARSLVGNILRPLDQLTKVAIKMARPPDRRPEEDHGTNESEESGQDTSEDEGAGGPDEGQGTPDIYRNSALGMYGGEMDDMNFEGQDEEMLDGDHGAEEDEMDLEFDEVDTDSENTSEDMDDVGPEEDIAGGLDPEGWHESGDDEEGTADEPEVEMLSADEIAEDDIDAVDGVWEDMHLQEGLNNHDDDDAADNEDILAGLPGGEVEDEEDEDVEGHSDDFAGHLELIEEGDDPTIAHEHTLERAFGQWFDVGAGPVNDRDVFNRPGRRRATGDFTQNPLFGNPRAAHQTSATGLAHPLLTEPSSTPGQRDHQFAVNHRLLREGQPGNIISSLEELVGPNAIQFFQQLLSRGNGGEIVGLEVPSAGIVATVDRSGNIFRHTHAYTSLQQPPLREGSEDSETFSPAPTAIRWSDEAKVTQSNNEALRATRVGQHLIAILLPQARNAIQEQEQVERQRQREQEEKEKAAQEEKEKATQIEKEKLASVESDSEQRSPQSTENTAAAAVPSLDARPASPTQPPDTPADLVDPAAQLVDNAAQAMQEISVADDHVGAESLSNREENVGETRLTEPERELEPQAGPSRVHVQIHGTAVDITDTGIDPAFLEALPDDMREEVLNQQLREQRSAAAASQVSRDQGSQINSEFLEALPPEIRAELLDQEAEQARRRSQQTVSAAPATSGGPAEIDSATFLASLDPGLRQVVLMEQDETFLETLPPALLAEVTHYREADQSRYVQARQPREQTVPEPSMPRRLQPPRDAIHLLDKAGVTTLIRFLFYPQVLRKNTLQKVIINLCENNKTRTEVYQSVLSVLVEVTDPALLERSSHGIPKWGKSGQQYSYGKSPSKSRVSGVTEAGGLPLNRAVHDSGLTPQLIVQRCIETLNDVAGATESSPIFFLSEQEQPISLRRGSSKKGKGKEREKPISSLPYFPLSLLLSLLDSDFFLKNTAMMDSLVALLAIVTKPLVVELPKSSPPKEPPVHDQSQTNESPNSESHPDEGNSATTGDSQAKVPPQEEASTHLPEEPGPLLEKPPVIPPPTLRLVVNILTAGDCSGRTFQHCLSLIQHLSCIPDAKDVIVNELQAKAHELGLRLYADLQDLIQGFSVVGNTGSSQLPDAFATKFSLPSADQAKFLRILKTIEYLFTNSQPVTAPSELVSEQENGAEDTVRLSNIYKAFQFSSVWQRLSDFLSLLHERTDIGDHATVLLPLIESLMVVCKHTESPSSEAVVISSPNGKNDLFVTFTDSHRKVLNQMVRSNPSLMSGSFSLLIKNSRVLDFDNKRNYFTQQLRRRPHTREHHSTLQLNVRRARVFEDSYQYLQRKSGDQIKYGKLSIRFYGEEGVDAGGVTREWFTILARQMFNPDYALFQPCAADKLTYQPNRASNVNPEHLSFFKFVGRIIGKAIFDGRLLDAYFARSLFRQLLGKPVDYKDVEWVDPEYFKSLIWILENDPSPLDLTFIVEDSQFGVTTIVPLKENGENISVTLENRREYVQLSAEYRLVKSIKEQIDALLGGFYEIIPKALISIFNEQEVELLIAGTPDVDVDEWRAATDYHNYTSSDPVISWWWRALKSFNREEKAKLLGFATGTTRVPLGGFTELQGVQGVQRFSIHKAYGNPNRLPQAHTCFNQIDLPEYSSYEQLRASLLTAINEGSTGFGFA